ncbi:MAG: AI-2E family transporter [Acidimicrobiales bacterium]|nr:AI-2E family transporter [Acidimicrobiales bacterium]
MPVPAPLRTASEVAARALVVGLAVLLAGALLWKLRLVVLPVFIALLLATVLTPPVVALERRGWPSAVATAGVFLAFLAALAAVLTLVVPPTVDELSSTGSALQDGLDEVERWLVDGPLDLNRSTVQRYTDDPGGTLADLARSSSASLTRSVVVAGEVVAGALLSLVLTFFLAGAFLAVPLTGAAVGMGSVLWRRRHPEGVIDAPDDGAGPAGSRTGG